MNDCIFCKIMNGDIPSYTIYEDDLIKVFLDANPDTNGHMLIVPKKHIADFKGLDDELAIHINNIVKKMHDRIYERLNPDGLQFINNYGIYQMVKHYHLHIIPSYEVKQDILPLEEIYNKLK